MRLIIKILLMGLAVFIGAKVVPGVQVNGFGSAVLAAILIAIANATVGFILRLLTFPINFLTLGLVSFIITVLMVLMVDSWMKDFNTDGFLSAAIFSIVVALVNALYSVIAGSDKD
ncbi:phage holin family protein [Pedobacter sp. JY14-1]|uniref:phage holin family protein n=1 Tax=Pedobacter sp. JY14-1 TaxID=3034151 RepID=UPI0023E21D5C|nr:phage holin family protein [Pedobacter sp. JY14-1]